MRVICQQKNLEQIKDKLVVERILKNPHWSGQDEKLLIACEYKVYGISFWENSPWYYLFADEDSPFPIPFPSEFFTVSDDRLSSFWKFSVNTQDPSRVVPSLLLPEWAQDNPGFYERALEGGSQEAEVFMIYRGLMEFDVSQTSFV